MSGAPSSEILRRVLDGPHGHGVDSHHERLGDATVVVQRDHLVALLDWSRATEGLEFDQLCDLCAVDLLGEEPRFEVVYHLYSTERNHRLRIKVRVPEGDAEVETSKSVWPSADWMEREVFDMYGISFRGHGDLRRILLYDEFEGHPLRKDYPKERRQPLIGPNN